LKTEKKDTIKFLIGFLIAIIFCLMIMSPKIPQLFKLIALEAVGVFMFILGLVYVIRYAQVKFRGARATATLTNITRKSLSQQRIRYNATAEWYDEDNCLRSGKVTLRGRKYFKGFSAPPRAREEIYYNKRLVLLVKDDGYWNNAIYTLLIGLMWCASVAYIIKLVLRQ